MPNFHTHWLAALDAIEAAPQYIQTGFNAYKTAVETFGADLHRAIRNIKTEDQCDNFTDSQFKKYEKSCESAIEKYLSPITCFSAYTLGACGPDFWTLPSEAEGFFDIIPDTAGIHFDLGHYNRTHRLFQIACARWAAGGDLGPTAFQGKVERSYYYGMASHFATDVVLHQLVNVYAGAYNLLEKKFENEHGSLENNIWSTHNKVEHFWDSFLRYRYLGDYGQLWPGTTNQPDVDADSSWIKTCAFPTVPKLQKLALAKSDEDIKEKLLDWLDDEDNRYEIEKYLILPRIVANRMIKKEVQPFIYDIAVNKADGSYPGSLIFSDAQSEATGYQMKDPDNSSKFNEKRKINFFTDAINRIYSGKGYSIEYLSRIVCPDLTHTIAWGADKFYHTDALKPFLLASSTLSKVFIGDLSTASNAIVKDQKADDVKLGSLGGFWNLDTGLGIEVIEESDQTVLSFTHINNVVSTAQINGYSKETPYLTTMNGKSYANPTEGINKEIKKNNTLLTIQLKSSIASLAGSEQLAFYTYCDKKAKVDDAVKHGEERTKKWLKEEATKVIWFWPRANSVSTTNGVCNFESPLAMKLSKKQDAYPTTKKQTNTIDQSTAMKYGRNFAVAVGRDNILHPKEGWDGEGNFKPGRFDYYNNVSPSGHIFFSLYPLIKYPDYYYDLINHEELDENKFAEIKKIDCLGVVKIVLVYQPAGKLDDCYIDAMKVTPGPIPKPGPPPTPPAPPPEPEPEPKEVPGAWLPSKDDVTLLQEYLCGKRPGLENSGYYLGKYGPDGDGVDGISGPKTKGAVKEFQRDHGGLAIDGIYGPNTEAAFDMELNG